MPSLKPESESVWWQELTPRLLKYWEESKKPVNILYETERGFWANHNQVQVKSTKRMEFYQYPVTWLYQCDLCGCLKIPRWVRYAPWVWVEFKWNCFNEVRKVCMGCSNRLRAQERRILEVYELEKLVKQVNQKRLECQRIQPKT